jgi:hypothetical protein
MDKEVRNTILSIAGMYFAIAVVYYAVFAATGDAKNSVLITALITTLIATLAIALAFALAEVTGVGTFAGVTGAAGFAAFVATFATALATFATLLATFATLLAIILVARAAEEFHKLLQENAVKIPYRHCVSYFWVSTLAVGLGVYYGMTPVGIVSFVIAPLCMLVLYQHVSYLTRNKEETLPSL